MTTVPEAADLDLLATETENDLRTTLRDLLVARCPSDAVAAVYDGDRSIVDPLWRALALELGLAGLLVPEDRGGVGASAREAAVVLEELGRACAPVPFLTSAVVATSVLLAADGDVASSELAAVASGERTAALVVPFSASAEAALPEVFESTSGLTGSVRSVAGGLEADLLVVPVRTATGVSVHLVERAAATVTPVSSLDMSRQLADVTLDDAASTELLAEGEAAVRSALAVGAGLLASEQAGVAAWCLAETVAYLKVRKQFGRVVGGFQALKHRLADLYAEVNSASAAARYAAAAIAAGEDQAVSCRVAAAYCSDVAVHAAEEAVQLHGGIGMTWEHPAHLYLKKAKADQIGLGTAGAHRAALADLVDLPLGRAAR
ncbi:acyl-CoA dehydrogenase family protein [Nocardioides sp. LS1]|uniref:acyl-CoA dehydrogenase family protein n=1 Tax=Nocardioides sp. LS1 TaxID=1027620 RepID=UPI000FF94493|nr:acyl-CoA dehydrogenase family protein [Nocardioides sp. LS1]GCD88150.1 acyl-CoA dehydrogenase [Nocardioides sp. LS1]